MYIEKGGCLSAARRVVSKSHPGEFRKRGLCQEWPEHCWRDLNQPKWTSSGQNGPFWSILVSRILKSSSEQGLFDQNGSLEHFGPVWSTTLLTVPRPLPTLFLCYITARPLTCRSPCSGRDRWVDSSCADCPVSSLFPGSAAIPASSRSLGLCPSRSICSMVPWTCAWICCPQPPYHQCRYGMHRT